MKYKSLHIIIISLVFVFSSCSSDDKTFNNSDVLGVWDRVEVNTNATTLFRIVLGNASQAIKINRTDANDGTVVSSAESYEWRLSGGEVRLLGTNDDELIFTLNTTTTPPQLETLNEAPLLKVSDDFSDFFEN